VVLAGRIGCTPFPALTARFVGAAAGESIDDVDVAEEEEGAGISLSSPKNLPVAEPVDEPVVINNDDEMR
jgi:hypothetical protein